MFSVNKPGHPMPTPPSDENHRPNHPEKPCPPVGPGHPEPPEKPDNTITVVVNGVDKVLQAGVKQLSYKDVVVLAYGNYSDANNIIYSIAYSNGPAENRKGVLVKGDSVHIQKGMIFNVGCSNKS